MDTIDLLLKGITAECRENKTRIIAVCGAADLGKSWLSAEVVARLKQQGNSATTLSLDAWLINRAKRLALGLSGYEPGAYDTESIINTLTTYVQGNSIQYIEYDHSTGQCSNSKRSVSPCQYLFLDGLHSMHELFKPFVDSSVFIYTSDQQLQQIRHQANITKRKQSEKFSIKSQAGVMQKYKENVESYKDKASFRLELKDKVKESWNCRLC